MPVRTTYQYLESRPDSRYRQLFIKGRHVRAEVVYRQTVNSEPRSPEQVARDFDIPIDAVCEAIDYSIHNKDLLDAERASEQAAIEAKGWDKPPYASPDYRPQS